MPEPIQKSTFHYQPENLDVFVNHAHNDYLGWVFDGGITALVLILTGRFIFTRDWLSG